MNIYDFDKTLYGSDSTMDFMIYSFKKHPGLVRFLPGIGWAAALYAMKRIDKTAMKQRFIARIKTEIHQLTDEINNHKTELWGLQELNLPGV